MTAKRLGFFTRLLDRASAAERYRLAVEQIVHAEKLGFDSAWVAQHHFHENEGGLPSAFPFLGFVAARTSRILLATGVITLPMENPVRVAEDAAIVDLLSNGRLDIGFGTGTTQATFEAFGVDYEKRNEIYAANLRAVLDAWRGAAIGSDDNHLYPAAPHLVDRVWQATFSVRGGARAGSAGDGLMLSRTQPRAEDALKATLPELQHPIIDAYLAALPAGRKPRIVGSRSVFVADDRQEAFHYAEAGLTRFADRIAASGRVRGRSLADLIRTFDVHVGTPDDVIASLRADSTLDRVTDLVFQVHPIDPPPPLTLRSIELIAEKVAPALGWQSNQVARRESVAAK